MFSGSEIILTKAKFNDYGNYTQLALLVGVVLMSVISNLIEQQNELFLFFIGADTVNALCIVRLFWKLLVFVKIFLYIVNFLICF